MSDNAIAKLVTACKEENRYKWALEWKEAGGKVMGILDAYVPYEVVYAAGFLPCRVFGTWRLSTPLADVQSQPWVASTHTHILEAALGHELDFLDGVISSDWDIALTHCFDAWKVLKPASFMHCMDVTTRPSTMSALSYGRMHASVMELKEALETYSEKRITSKTLSEAIEIYNETRSLVHEIYELRKKEIPPLSGAEFLGVTTAGLLMPPEQYNSLLKALLSRLPQRKACVDAYSPRLMISSDWLDNPAYLELVESTGCVVAMDDLDTGSRFYWGSVEDYSHGPVHALAKRYLDRPPCPRMYGPGICAKQVLRWVREFGIDMVLELVVNNSLTRSFKTPALARLLSQHGIPFISLTREYHLASVEQLRTRIGAFVESWQAKSGSSGRD